MNNTINLAMDDGEENEIVRDDMDPQFAPEEGKPLQAPTATPPKAAEDAIMQPVDEPAQLLSYAEYTTQGEEAQNSDENQSPESPDPGLLDAQSGAETSKEEKNLGLADLAMIWEKVGALQRQCLVYERKLTALEAFKGKLESDSEDRKKERAKKEAERLNRQRNKELEKQNQEAKKEANKREKQAQNSKDAGKGSVANPLTVEDENKESKGSSDNVRVQPAQVKDCWGWLEGECTFKGECKFAHREGKKGSNKSPAIEHRRREQIKKDKMSGGKGDQGQINNSQARRSDHGNGGNGDPGPHNNSQAHWSDHGNRGYQNQE